MSLTAVLGHAVGKKKKERRAKTKYDYNYTDRAVDYREQVAQRRQVSEKFVGQRWHMYDNNKYWDEKYYIPPDQSIEDAHDEAYNDFAAVLPHIEPYLENVDGCRVLILGCGTSQIGRQLQKMGFTNIVNADLSPKLIHRMLEPAELLEGVDCVCVDATNMYMFPEGWFDLIIDKALLDTLFTKTSMMRDVPKMIDEVSRVLAPGGTYFVFSVGPPSARQDYFQRKPLHWRLRCGKSTHGIYTYACTQPLKESENMNYLD